MQRPSVNKDTLRSTLRQQRANLSPALQKQKSESIVQHIQQSQVFKSATHIAFYSPVQGEVNPLPVTQLNSKIIANKYFYLPILQGNEAPLLFAPFSNQSEWLNNRFEIPEPVYKKSELITADALDLVLMPLLGFDKQGNRLGMGGGFYDRTFAFKKQKNSKPTLMGIAYDFQEVESLKAEDWDIPLDYMVTESQFTSLKQSL
jgi:5-formyltetrahydrofolate cyclo-ligase